LKGIVFMTTAATGALHPDLSRIAQEIRDTQAQFETLCAGLSDTQFNWRSAPGRWSIAQCLAHLNAVNGPDINPMSAAIASARKHSPGPYHYPWLWRYFIRITEPPAKIKFKVPKSYQPPPNSNFDTTLSEYRRICTALIDLVQRANGLDLAQVKTPLPAIRFLKMPLGARLHLLTAHDRRHLGQAREVRTHPDSPHKPIQST
jgi:hypothetical protein